MRRAVCIAFAAFLTLCARCSSAPDNLPPVGTPQFDEAIVLKYASERTTPLARCEFSEIGGRRLWEHVDVIRNDGTFLTLEYPNREREISGERRGLKQQKRVLLAARTIGPCPETMFTPTAEAQP